MIPIRKDIEAIEVEETIQPSKSYLGLDGLDALKYSVSKILSTERYRYAIYSWNYGIETTDLYGMPHDYVAMELKRRIKEALTQDDRVLDIEDFKYERGTASFKVVSSVGDFDTEVKYENL